MLRFSGCYVSKTFELLFDKILESTRKQNSSRELEDRIRNLEVEVTTKERMIKEKDEEIKILFDRLKNRDEETSKVTKNSNTPPDQLIINKEKIGAERRRLITIQLKRRSPLFQCAVLIHIIWIVLLVRNATF